MSSRDFLFDVDLLVLARRLGFDLVEVPTVWIDQAGSKVRAARRHACGCWRAPLRLWIHHRTMPVGPGLAAGTPPRRPPTTTGTSMSVRPDVALDRAVPTAR